ncbi:hypothetical protein SVAN01_08188 [Stagonosporopsis vannaccii]|nr:hypothetical protein SVAN01_08188 [Stagonosporopsis vannaccii]
MLNSLAALALLTTTTTTLAQSSNTTTNSTDAACPQHPRFNLDSPVNSSATVPIPHSNTSSSSSPWYLTVALNDTRSASSVDTSLWGFLSTPPNATGETCVFLMKGELLDAQTGENGDCAGSLSANCVDAIRRSMEFTGEGARCPNLPSLESVQGACGNPLGQGWQGASTGPIDAANVTCTDDRVPGTQQPPDGYTSTALFGLSGFGDAESDRADPTQFTWYERYVSRPYPWVVAHRGENDESWTSVVCVTPGEVGEGSRDPETSGAGTREVAWGGVAIMGLGAVMGLL